MDQHERADADVEAAALVELGLAADLSGDHDQAVRLLQQAYGLQLGCGSTAQALHSAFLLALVFGTSGRPALFNGWLHRAQRLLLEMPGAGQDSRARGYVAVLELHRSLESGAFEEVGPLAEEVARIGREHHDPDLTAFGLTALGRHAIYSNDVPRGLSLLDEAMAGVLAGEPSGRTSGMVFCAAIEGCQEIGSIDRMCQWTSELQTWCAVQPGVTPFAGNCALHQGQVLALHGDWTQAIREFDAARSVCEEQGLPLTAGYAEHERGVLLLQRGNLGAAEGAFRRAAELGYDPQPGLAHLWIASGLPERAVAAIRRCLAEITIPARRIHLLPAATEILLGAGDVRSASALLEEQEKVAGLTRCEPVVAAAAQSRAAVQLALNAAGEALTQARRALRLWSAIAAHYEMARARVLLARALRGLGDEESASRELDTARGTFEELGAAPALEATTALETPAATVRDGLTDREVEVLRLVAAGHSTRDIAAGLFLSEKTVARHLSNIYNKLGVGSRTQAAAYAYRHGLA